MLAAKEDAMVELRRLHLDPRKAMVVERFCRGYGRRTVLCRHPGRDEPIMLWCRDLALDRRAVEQKRADILRKRKERDRVERESKYGPALAAAHPSEEAPF